MDFQNRAGVKFGAGAPRTETAADKRERLRRLATETIDLSKDPYLYKNHIGLFECKLCSTLHTNDGSYLSHTQGKRHQMNLARRASKAAGDTVGPAAMLPNVVPVVPIRKVAVKIGRPGYKVTKIRDPVTLQVGLLVQVHYPNILETGRPMYRFMSSFEQRQEVPSKFYQYLLLAADPYETIAFKIQTREIDRKEGRLLSYWDPESKQYHLQFFFK